MRDKGEALKVAVVGAGVVGSSVAYYLSGGGAEVVLIDGAEPGSGTTSTSFAWVNANNKLPREYFELNVAGMREHERLHDEIGGGWFHATGNLILSEQQRDLESRVERLRSWSYAAEMVPASAVNEGLEPGVVFPDPGTGVAHFPEESWVDAPALTRRLVQSTGRNGALTLVGDAVRGIEVGDEGVTLRLENGDTVHTGAVVNATGAKAASVAEMVERELPLDVFRGLLVRIAVAGEPLHRLVHTPRINVRPDGAGYVLLHHGSVDEKLTDDFAGLEDPLCEELLERGRLLIPALAGGEVVEARFGMRPVPADGHSCVGALPEIPSYYEAVTHSGVTLGPLVGRLLAREILTGEVDPLIAPFRPDRFSRTWPSGQS
ncbi:MAG: FAD-binding oxidoreductase [Rubrobacter sp.]|nr:FAD-binding oxidoreductase [Rubrobacter sp.]